MRYSDFRALSRRELLARSGAAAALLAAGGPAALARDAKEPPFTISLAQWSLHRALFAGRLDALDFARTARNEFGLDAVEYVNAFFFDKAQDRLYIAELKSRAADHGVQSLLIMVDNEGALGDPDEPQRKKTVENHYKWVDAARALGCHSVRVNAHSHGGADEQARLAADGLRRLTEFAARVDLNVIVENHGGLSSNGAWLAKVMKLVDHPRCGTLPDFGNFRKADGTEYDRYEGVKAMMPFAKAVSAKSYDFDAQGNETRIDYRRMLKIVLAAGYHGRVGIEYEGDKLSETEGIHATRRLLEKVRDELSAG